MRKSALFGSGASVIRTFLGFGGGTAKVTVRAPAGALATSPALLVTSNESELAQGRAELPGRPCTTRRRPWRLSSQCTPSFGGAAPLPDATLATDRVEGVTAAFAESVRDDVVSFAPALGAAQEAVRSVGGVTACSTLAEV